jgi:phosphonate transport system substrate-binding protein
VKKIWIILVGLLLVLLIGLLVMLGGDPPGVAGGAATAGTRSAPGQAIRIGLVPERDIFTLRKRNRALADYLQKQLGRPVELVTASSYGGILRDFQENQVDAAFLGSLVAVLAMDRMNAQVMLKTELPSGVSAYHGVICVPEDSPIQDVNDLAGRRLAVVRTTTGGNLFPLYSLAEHGIVMEGQRPRLLWMGTHDDAVGAMMRGEADAAGVKDLRLQAVLAANPQWKVRVLVQSDAVPENALVVRGDLAATLGNELAAALLKMDQTPEGQAALQSYGARRFLPCRIEEFGAIYDIVDRIGPAWPQLGIDGPAPRDPRHPRAAEEGK